jgi:citrate lyase subunit beta / citryl-CoA lyase
MNDYVLRSCMFVPGHNDRLLNSAAKSKADVLLLDLEDSVQSAHYKQIARDKIEKRIREGDFIHHFVFPRVNDRESGFLLKDVTQLAIDGVDGFMYPKSYTGQDIYFFDKLLETIEAEKGIPFGTFKIIPLIETSAAVLNAQEICQASDRVVAIAFGCEDFITDLEGIHDKEGQSLFTARALIAMAAKANKVVPIDTVHIKVHDLDDLERNIQLAKKLGFEGMLVLNPKELELVHKYFTPSKEEIFEAYDMLKLYEESLKEHKGVAVKNGKFIGPPMVVTAKKIIKKAKLIKAILKAKEGL